MSKSIKLFITCMVAGLASAHGFSAPANSLTGGYTSAITTPITATLASGDISLSYANSLNIAGIDNRGIDLSLGLGLFDNFEVYGVVASHDLNTNCFTNNCGLRDLSVSAKYRLPELATLMAIRGSPWIPSVALGGTDIAGETKQNTAYYGVAQWDLPQWKASAGWGKVRSNKIHSMLDGPFGSLSWTVSDYAQPTLEYLDGKPQIGSQFFYQPTDWQASFHGSFYVRPQDDKNKWGFGLGVQRSMDYSAFRTHTKFNRTNSNEGRSIEAETIDSSVNRMAQANSHSLHSGVRGDLNGLVQQLSSEGFNDIAIKQGAIYTILVDAQSFDWNITDAMGAALKQVYRWSSLQSQSIGVRLVLQKYGIPLVAVETDTACLSRWAGESTSCQSLVIRRIQTDGLAELVQGVQWDYQSTGWTQSKVEFYPKLAYTLATEYGVLDYSLGLGTSIKLPLGWNGSLAEIETVIPVRNSEDFQTGSIYQSSALQSGIERAVLHQFWVPAPQIMAHVMGGQLGRDETGVLAESQWQNHTGGQQFRLSAGAYTLSGKSGSQVPVWAGYRYQWKNMQVGVDAGRFYGGDSGLRLSSQWWYGDTAVQLQFAKTKDPEVASLIGLQISFPLTTRKNLYYSNLHLGGDPDYSKEIRTRVHSPQNTLVGSRARDFSDNYTIDTLRNRDRLSEKYVLGQQSRIKAAFLAY